MTKLVYNIDNLQAIPEKEEKTMRNTETNCKCFETPCATAFSACKTSACATVCNGWSNISGTAPAVSLFVILVLGLCLLSVCAILVIGLIAGLLATIAVLAVLSVRIIMMVRGVSYPLKRDLPYSDPV